MKRRILLAVALFAAAFSLYLHRIGGRFSNGDETIYAQAAREMATGGDWLTIRWQGEPHLVRPPTAIWPLAIVYRLFGPAEAPLRAVCAFEGALAVALLFLFAARRWDLAVGVVAALTLAISTLWYRYARFIEPDPLLCLFIIAALLCWEHGRTNRRWLYGWGLCFGGALMTKPFVGALPLLAPLADLAERRPLPWRAFGRALGLAFLVAAPWHVYEAIKFGPLFGRAFFVENILHRSSQAFHQENGPSYYYLMFWYLEGPAILIAALGLVWAALKREWLVVLWVALVLVPFTLARSRYNYYVLPVYPALALATALALVRALPRWRWYLAGAFLVTVVSTRLIPNITPPESDDQIAGLARLAKNASRPDDVLFVIDQYAFSARYYSERPTIEVHMKRGWEPKSLVLPGRIEDARDFAKVAAGHPRWFAIAPRNRWKQLRTLGTVQRVGQSEHYLLFTNLERPD